MGDAFGPRELALEDLEWLRRLAARLVRDPHTAEDAVQDTLVIALQARHGPAGSLRAWLARVLGNALRQEWRSRARRSARESMAGARAGEPEPHEVVGELALHRRLADEVERLAEPYRTAVLLRYLRGAEVSAIARELGVPEKTVRSRLERGRAQLRERLGRDREAWLACLALVRSPVSTPSPTLLPWIVTMNLKVASAVAGLSLLGVLLVLREPAAKALAKPELALVSPLAEVPVAERDVADLVSMRKSLAAAPQSSATPPAIESVELTPLLRGAVRTLDGTGVALEVVFVPEGAPAPTLRTHSAADGSFELPLPDARGLLDVEDEHYACVVGPYLTGRAPVDESIVVVAPGVELAGHVRSTDGTPIEGASLALTLPGPIVQSRDVGGSAVHLLLPFEGARSDAQGHFAFARSGYVEGLELVAEAEGFEPLRRLLAPRSDERLELVLTPSTGRPTLHGLVLQASGAPAAGALVSLGTTTAQCASDGTFALDPESWRTRGWLRAVAPRQGATPGILNPPGVLPAELELEQWPVSSPTEPIVLTLGPAALTLVGRVLDAAGAPVPFAEVFTPDTTPFGQVEREENGRTLSAETTLEAYLAGQRGPGQLTVTARADSEGRFELRGLLGRPYALFALDPRTLAAAGPEEAWPGRGPVELRLAAEELRRVAGRVVSRSGRPLAGVTLRLARELAWEPEASVRAERWIGFHLSPPNATCALRTSSATTDAEGRFELGPLADAGAYLVLGGPVLALAAMRELTPEDDLEALEIRVEAATRFQIVLRQRDEADAFALLDADGEERVLFLEVNGLTITAVHPALDSGRSGTVLAREGDFTLVLLRDGQEVRRAALTLEPGGLFELEF
jgi:RNA polymerase sigma-70 factor (ECF subfamily)